MAENLRAKFWTTFDRIADLMFICASIIIVYQMVSISLNAFSAYLFNFTVTGVEAFAEWGLLFIVFLAATRILRMEKHVIMDIVIGKISAQKRSILIIFTSLLSATVCLVLILFGVTVAWDLWVREIADDMKLIGFPKAIPVLIIPVGSLFLLIQFIRRAFLALQDAIRTK